MFAAVVSIGAIKVRSSFFPDIDEAVDYAGRMPGVECIEEIGGDVVWRREENSDDSC
jgi:hypothetical protein